MAVDLKKLHQRWEMLVEKRQPWISTWKDLAALYLPTGYRDADDGNARGGKNLLNPEVVDSTGIYALRTLAAGMQGGMTSPARPWFGLRLEGGDSGDGGITARAWIDEVVERMRTILHTSNFYGVIYQAYAQLAAFGTACVFERADMSGFTFDCCQAGTFVLDVDAGGRVDTVMRKIWLTARQMAQEFGEDALPDMVKTSLNNASMGNARHAVFHAVYPRREPGLRRETINGARRPFASVYWMRGMGGAGGYHPLRESGFDSFPFFGVRWNVLSGDVYGTSPAMDTMPDCRMLQQMAKTTLKGVHKMVDPPVNVAAELQSVGVDLTPGGVNYVSMMGNNGAAVTPVLKVQPDVAAAQAMIQQVQQQIKEGLYNDLFRMLLGTNRRQITATEVDAREAEKMILIGPVLERLHDELFIPLIDRTFALMDKFNALPPVPEELAGRGLKVEFISTLAQAQKLVSTGGIQQLLAFIGGAAQVDPSVLDALNGDRLVDKYNEYLGVDAGVLRPQEEREAIRERRAQAQAQAAQQAQAQAAMEQLPRAAKTLADTPMGGEQPSALDALLGGIGGY
ncbi:portal protein [Desulfovibrio sp.]|uniref:portal protein n=1 Tax=Desulfovibrio sp. TaxID=885 RepID=UPI0025B94D92|nr:portal protein [Desulfovibrio sp.]